MLCNNCNKKLPDDSEFCQYCGKKTVSNSDFNETTDSTKASVDTSKKDAVKITAEIHTPKTIKQLLGSKPLQSYEFKILSKNALRACIIFILGLIFCIIALNSHGTPPSAVGWDKLLAVLLSITFFNTLIPSAIHVISIIRAKQGKPVLKKDTVFVIEAANYLTVGTILFQYGFIFLEPYLFILIAFTYRMFVNDKPPEYRFYDGRYYNFNDYFNYIYSDEIKNESRFSPLTEDEVVRKRWNKIPIPEYTPSKLRIKINRISEEYRHSSDSFNTFILIVFLVLTIIIPFFTCELIIPEPSDSMYILTLKTETLHKTDCRYAYLTKSNYITFISANAKCENDYNGCGHCNPYDLD